VIEPISRAISEVNSAHHEIDVDELLARRSSWGEHEFHAVYRQFAPQIYRHLFMLLGHAQDVEDAVQQTFFYAFKNLNEFRGESRFSTWLHGIAVRVALNTIRSRKRRRAAMSEIEKAPLAEEANRNKADDRLVAGQLLHRLEASLAKLPALRQVAFLLYYVEDLDLGEVALRLNCRPAALWKQIRRTRSKLVDDLAHQSIAKFAGDDRRRP
jgi:RNA polymerase sigma-70 factor, ECF subfamily